ncbi:MAG: class I SAM-dependent methyltransferase [Moraxellaceae bacterium]|nr:class I SAM-dependent methyltransferase [Moraxellaceae bacterium]
MSGFKDHFSGLATDYAAFRPRYPAPLFADLAAVAPGHSLAWDCATGNGQAAAGLAVHFDQVIATDASAEQIASASGPRNVRFAMAPAEASGLVSASVDLVLVAQAAHWFDLPAFYAEAARVLKPGGVLALLTYSGVRINATLDPILREYHQVTMGPWWPPERAHVETGYRDLDFPWPELAFPAQEMTADWTLAELLGYLGTWSSTSRCRAATGLDPLQELAARLAPLWGEPTLARTVRWPLPMRVGRRP